MMWFTYFPKKNITKYFVTILVFAFIFININSCKSTKNTRQNVAYLYQDKSVIQPLQLKVHHTNNSTSDVYIGISNKQLQFDTLQKVHLQAVLSIYDATQKDLLDSIKWQVTIPKSGETPILTLQKNIPLLQGYNYWLQLLLIDNLSNRSFKTKVLIRKENPLDENNFLLTNTNNNAILFSSYAKNGQELAVNYRNNDSQNLEVYYFKPIRELALPPFVTNKKRPLPSIPDSVFTIQKTLTINKLGLYFIKANGEANEGISVLAVNQSFPKLSSAIDLVESLRFITRNEEFIKLKNATNTKQAVDNFWLQRAGSPERGKVLIREFYGRVQRANQYFTSFKEGWKTDRGLIYIIYGAPDEVYATVNGEQWQYKANQQNRSLYFTFYKKSIPLTHGYYRLKRDPSFEESWHNMVYEWRKGIIHNGS